MDPTNPTGVLPPVDLLVANGAILLPSVVVAWWLWHARRHGKPPGWWMPIAIWGLATVSVGLQFFDEFVWKELAGQTRAGYLGVRHAAWSIAFESLAGLTVLVVVGSWFLRRSEKQPPSRPRSPSRRLSRALAPLILLDTLFAGGLALFFLAPDIPLEISTFQSSDDGLWIGARSVFEDEPSLFFVRDGSTTPRVESQAPSKVAVLLEAAATPSVGEGLRDAGSLESGGSLLVGGRGKLYQRPLDDARANSTPWPTLDAPMTRTLAIHGDSVWAGGINPLLRFPLDGSGPGVRLRTEDLPVGVLREVDFLQPQGESLWIGTRRGLFHWQPAMGNQAERVLPDVQRVDDLLLDDEILWVGSDRQVVRWDLTTDLREWIQVPDTIEALHLTPVSATQRWLWIGGGKGLYRVEGLPTAGEIQVTSDLLNRTVYDGPARVRHFLATANGDLWLGGLRRLHRWQPKTRRFEPFAPELDWITALAETSEGLWIGTWRDGLYRLPPGASPTTQPERIDLGDVSHGWHRRDRLAQLALGWLVLLGLVGLVTVQYQSTQSKPSTRSKWR